MRNRNLFIAILIITVISTPLLAQKKGLESINQQDLEMHMDFLASDELKGRATGDPGLLIAARYLAAQAKYLGLKSEDDKNGYYQSFEISEKSYDREKCQMFIVPAGSDAIVNQDSFYLWPPASATTTCIEGEVVFAGYGINDSVNNYNDFQDIEIKDKIVMIMDRAPMNEDGSEAQFDNEKWNNSENNRNKMTFIKEQKPKALLVVHDPKSGFNSLGERFPQFVNSFEGWKSLKGDEEENGFGSGESEEPISSDMIDIHRSVADQLLNTAGRKLADIQKEIDSLFTPQSFLIQDVSLNIELVMKEKIFDVPNIFGIIEGSDPVLKNEFVIYVAHYDHIGTDGKGGVFNGADDNASGTVALIEIAQAFMKEKKQTKRSIGFLWVSAEEIGLFGSKYFAENPLVPVEDIAAVINLDMISRSQTEEDRTSSREGLTIAGGDSVEIIGGLQSKILMELNKEALDDMNLRGNYRYNDPDHPFRFFYRSDHISFAQKDVPVIFYSTGTHNDYHRLADNLERVDYERFVEMTKLAYLLGYKVANYKGAIEVENPMSSWQE